jgi:hypothetical protein
MQRSISVGVYDWYGFAPKDGFYPDDLPRDWRFGYYSNEFNSACIDLSRTVVSLDELCEWTEDLPSSFELSFAIADNSHLELLRGWLESDHPRLHALVLQDRAGNNLLQHQRIDSVLSTVQQAEVPRYVAASEIWRPEQPGSTQPFALLAADRDMRTWRSQVQHWANELDAAGRVESASLWLPGSETGYRQLVELRQMIELMGY